MERDTTLGEWLEELREGQKDHLYLAEVALGKTLPQVVDDIGTVAYGNRDPNKLMLMMVERRTLPFTSMNGTTLWLCKWLGTRALSFLRRRIRRTCIRSLGSS